MAERMKNSDERRRRENGRKTWRINVRKFKLAIKKMIN